MHTDKSLEVLSKVTGSLGNGLRMFEAKTCAVYQTREMERERVARQRRQDGSAASTTTPSGCNGRKPKALNLRTYKLHALGDYVETIRRLGTTDSYSTQPVSICNGLLIDSY